MIYFEYQAFLCMATTEHFHSLGNYDVMVEICDSVGACANVKHMKAISVEPKIFTSTELDNTAALINEALKSGNSLLSVICIKLFFFC